MAKRMLSILHFHLLTINILSTSLILVVLEKQQVVAEDVKLIRPLKKLKKNVKVQFKDLLKSLNVASQNMK
jgi:D-arabinose 5-phosphate isomerase GutQ